MVSALNESIRVSNAASQVAVPFMMTTFFGASVNSSPKGSAVWTLAAGGGGGEGDWAVDGASAGDLVSAGGGTGATDAAGAGVGDAAGAGDAAGDADGLAAGEADGAGDCARAAPPSAMATIGTSATVAARNVLIMFIRVSPSTPGGSGMSPIAPARMALLLTRKAGFRPMTDASCAPADWSTRHYSPYKTGINWEIP